MTATLIILPPQEAPRQLTAHAPTSTLRDHLLAFLAENNPQGYLPTLDVTLDRSTVSGRLQLIMQRESASIESLKSEAWDLKKIIPNLTHCQALEMIAAILGYYCWGALLRKAVDGRVLNMGNDARAQPQIYAAEVVTLRQAKRAVLRLRRAA